MADGSIIIDARLNKKGAESDLKALQAKAKSTAQQIAAVDKQLGGAQTKRNALADSLESARQKARETADALDEVNRQIDAAEQAHLQSIKSDYPSMSDAGVQKVLKARMQGETKLMEQQSKLLASSSNQESVLNETTSSYQAQDSAVQALQQQHDALTAQLEQENQAVKRQKDLIQHISGDDEMQAYFNKQAAAIESSFAKIEGRQRKLYGDTEETATQHAERIVAETKKALAAQDKDSSQRPASASQSTPAQNPGAGLLDKAVGGAQRSAKKLGSTLSGMLSNALRSVGSLGTKAFGAIQRAVQSVRNRLTRSAKALARFRNRLMSLVSGALIFNLVSAGLRKMTEWMSSAMLSSASLRAALGNLEGAAMTAAAPLIRALTPALTAIANAAATALYYVAKLISFLTGKSIGASQSAAKAMGKYAKAAKSAGKEANSTLAKFDEIDRLDNKNSGGAITPNYDFSGENPFLDEVLQAIEDGDWYGVGRLIGEKLRDALNAIPWPDIQGKAQEWATNLANCINGFIETPGLWESIGSTIAQGLNTALILTDNLMQGIRWESLGAGLAAGLTTAVNEINWPLLGNVLTDGLRAAILTLYGFVQTYAGWADLGNGISTCINAAIANIPWQQAGEGFSGFVIGLLTALINAVEGTNWDTLGQNIVMMISSIDWVGIFSALSNLAVDILTAINNILDQVNWDAVSQKIQDCLASVDWGGIFDQLGNLLNNHWPLLLAVLGAALLPQIGTFILSSVLNAILMGLGTLILSVISLISGWPLLIVAAVAVILVAVIESLRKHGDDIRNGIDRFGEKIAELLSAAGENIKEVWNACWTRVKEIAADLWAKIQQGWGDFWTGVKNALDTAAANIKQGWNNAWNVLAKIVSDIWDGITSTIKTAVNGIIGFINRMISAVVTGINTVINALNGLSFDLPDIFGGGHVGFNISTLTAPQIPYLAQGAVIPANREFLAVLGDQSHGTNVEAPQDPSKQAVAEVMEDRQAGQMARFEAVVSVLREILSAVYGIELTDEDVGRAVQRWQRKQLTATGGV